MSLGWVERFAFQVVICGYALLILTPYLALLTPWSVPVLLAAATAACAARGGDVHRLMQKFWDRIDGPQWKAAVYFAAALAPLWWLPFTGFRTASGTALLTLGFFLVPLCFKVMSRARLALLTAGLLLAAWLLLGPGSPGTWRIFLCLPVIGMLLILIPYALLVLILYQGVRAITIFLLTRASLMSAIESNNVFLVRRLLDAGKDVDGRLGDETPLHWAAALGRTRIVKVLLERGARIDPKNGADQTPLILAARAGHTNTVRLLLENGADIQAKDIRGENALSQAKAAGHEAAAELLEET
ncbi:MAG: ankyrin repeat domain-containing protein [Elusimicrobiota bacterium]